MIEQHTIGDDTERAVDRSEGGAEETAESGSDLGSKSESAFGGSSAGAFRSSSEGDPGSRSEGSQREGSQREGSKSKGAEPVQRGIDSARRLLASPAGPLVLGFALVAGSAAAIAARNARARPGLRSLLLRSRAAVAAFREPLRVSGTPLLAVLVGLTAAGLAGATRKRFEATKSDQGQ